MAKCYKIFFLLILLPTLLFAQNKNIKFEHISVEQGLSQSVINCILQDRHGFFWFGSALGLKKFDGYKIVNYQNDPDNPGSISGNNICAIIEDKSGNLWIGTWGDGLNLFNRELEKFIHYKFYEDTLLENKPKLIHTLLQDKSGIIWIGTNAGLYYLDEKKNSIIRYSGNQLKQSGININRAWALYEDQEGTIWIGSWRGLIKFDRQKNKFTHYKHNPDSESSLSNNTIRSIAEDKVGNLLIGTDNGLNIFIKKENKFIRYLYEPFDAKIGIEHQIRLLCPTKSGKTWIASGTGLLIFNPENKTFTDLRKVKKYDNLQNKSIMSLYEDSVGVLWIGTFSGEIFKYNPNRLKFIHYKTISDNPTGISHNFLLGIFKDSHGSLWVGTAGGGLNELTSNQFNISKPKWKYYNHDPNNSNSISHDGIYCIYEDIDSTLWIGTAGGLNKLIRPKTNLSNKINQLLTTSFIHHINGLKISYNDIIYCILEDTNKNLWIGTHSGIYKFDRSTESFIFSGGDHDIPQNLGHKRVNCILESKSGHLWIGTWYAGMYKFDPETGNYVRYRRDSKNPNSLSSNNILMIYEDKSGFLWIATSRGLNRFDPNTGDFKHFVENVGLPGDDILAIFDDSEGNLWLSCNKGIIKFSPKSEEVKLFNTNDGLQSMEFNFFSYHKSKNGWMYFGGTNGLNAFHPDSLKYNDHIPEIVLTDFQIFNQSILPGPDSPFEITVSMENEIMLKHNQAIFSFEFAALDYSAPVKNLYAYKMDGVDPDWVYTDASRRFATYTNLDPGEYIFRVKGSNNDGIWNEEGTSIKVIILPPWWKSNWAYVIYTILFGFLLFGAWRIQTNRLKMKHQMEMDHFEAEKLREVDKLKSHFFANISHEFRTPLTLIKGPVKQIMDGTFTGNLKEQYKMILHNSDRLLGLINQILDLSKLESREIKLQVTETDIINYLKGMILSFSSLAESKKVALKFTAAENSLTGFVDRDKLEKILTNLLSNAFKFTPQGGEIEVSIIPLPSASPLIKGGHRGVEISISNTGPGIPAEQLDRIFNRFYQADDNYKKDSEGSGIGLALTKELVEVCHGEISVSSIPNKTTTFEVTLPISKENFKMDEIIQETETADRASEAERQILIEEENILVQSESEKRSPATSLHSPLLLIVEDNPDVTNYICSFMENDYKIITAGNGKLGLKKTLDKYPDLVISDVMMPEMDGFELCQKIKSDERISHIPIILLTARADLDSKIEGLEYGADDYVTKPFEEKELQIRSKNLIDRRHKLREKFSALIDLQPADITASSMDEQLLKRLLDVFEDHIDEPDYNLEQLSSEIGMTRTHLNRKIQALTNLSTRDFIRTIRLQRAAKLLSSASGTISEIAYKVGFNNLSYFSKAFRKHFGKLPSDFSRGK